MRSSSKRTSWFVTLPIAAGALGYLWLVFLPTARAIRETRADIRTKQDYISKAEALHSVLAQAKSDLKVVDAYTRQWSDQTSRATQLPHLFGKITQQTHEIGAVPTRFDPLKEVKMETLLRAPVQMEIVGDYEQIARVLASLERLPETIWVEQLKIEKQSEKGQDVRCEVKLEIFAGNSNKSG